MRTGLDGGDDVGDVATGSQLSGAVRTIVVHHQRPIR